MSSRPIRPRRIFHRRGQRYILVHKFLHNHKYTLFLISLIILWDDSSDRTEIRRRTDGLMCSSRHGGETPPITKLRTRSILTKNLLIEKPNTKDWPDPGIEPRTPDLPTVDHAHDQRGNFTKICAYL